MITTRKKIIFSLVPVTVMILLLVVAEAVVRRVVPFPEGELVHEVTFDGIEWYQLNRGYLKKYFPAGTPLVPEFKPTLFRRQRTPNLYRVICLGSSTMFGTPYLFTANIPAIVRKQLRHLHPEREIEVINLGASAINSNAIRDIAPELLRFQPDLVLVYMGHNEFYGPDGVGASFLEKRLGFLTPLKYRMREVRLYQLSMRLFAGDGPVRDPRNEQNLMRQVSQGSLVPLHSEDAKRVFRIFESNLREILMTFRRKEIPVIVSDIASNPMFPPFVSDSLTTVPNPRAVTDSIVAAFHSREYGTVLSIGAQVGAADSADSFLHYWKGRALRELGRHAEARHALLAAVDNDLLKFRAPSAINRIIHTVCAETGVSCVSTDSAFAEASPDNIPGDELFWEHLHPTALGYSIIAGLFVQEVETLRLVGGGSPSSATGVLPFDPDSLSICWLDLAYADLSIAHLTGRWPFDNYARDPVVLRSADPILLQIARDTYNRVTTMDEGALKSATYFWSRARFREAMTTYEALIEEYPFGFYPQYLLGSLLNHMGQPERALVHYRRSIASNPAFPKPRLDLGLIEINRGNFDVGIRELNLLLGLLNPQGTTDVRATALYGLAVAFANKGEYATALGYTDQALALVPGYRDALRLRAEIQQGRGR